MKYWTIAFPGEHGQNVVETWSEDQIIKSYWTYWYTKMIQAGKGDDATTERCIEDWTTVHWACRTDEFGRKTFGDCDCGCNEPVAKTPESMLKFLAHRFEYAGVDDGVARTYARDIRYVLKEHYGVEL